MCMMKRHTEHFITFALRMDKPKQKLMQIREIIKRNVTRTFVWFVRFRHRKGYGVHSPFAFGYITRTIYAPLPADVRRQLRGLRDGKHRFPHRKAPVYTPESSASRQGTLCVTTGNLPPERMESGRLRRLIYNMVCRTKPESIVVAGSTTDYTLLYIEHAQPDGHIVFIGSGKELHLQTTDGVGFAYINAADDTAFVRSAFDIIARHATPQTALLVNGINVCGEMKRLWREMVCDERSGITFDLYEAGIVLFDKKITKQDYIVNF